MLYKKPSNNFFTSGKVKSFILIETASLAVAYVIWSAAYKSQDCRYFMYQYCPAILNGYYYLYETVSNDKTLRLLDNTAWENKQNES